MKISVPDKFYYYCFTYMKVSFSFQPKGYLLFRDYATGDLAQVDMQSTTLISSWLCACIFLFFFAICVQEFWDYDNFSNLIFMLALLLSH